MPVIPCGSAVKVRLSLSVPLIVYAIAYLFADKLTAYAEVPAAPAAPAAPGLTANILIVSYAISVVAAAASATPTLKDLGAVK